MGKIKSMAISQARPKLAQLVEEVSSGGEPYLIIANSELKAVLMGIEEYNSLQERLEDLEDTVDILKADLAGEPTMSFAEHLKKCQAEKKVGVSD